MKYNCCGTSGLLLPAISLGGWHHFDSFEKTRDLTLAAFDAGITHFDMANNYGPPPGSAELHLGGILSSDLVCHRDELIISTKAGYDMWSGPYGSGGSRKHLLCSLDQSLRRLRLGYVDIFYSHRYDPATPLEETMGALDTAVRTGRALYAAISNYPPEAVKEAAAIMDDLGTPLLAHQCAYSMLNRGVENEILRRTGKRGMGFIAFSPLAQGLLSPRYLEGVPSDSRAAQNQFLKKDSLSDDLVGKLKKLAALASSRGQTLNRLALQWCLRDERVTSAVIGARDTAQLASNCLALMDSALTECELKSIEKILDGTDTPPATAKALTPSSVSLKKPTIAVKKPKQAAAITPSLAKAKKASTAQQTAR